MYCMQCIIDEHLVCGSVLRLTTSVVMARENESRAFAGYEPKKEDAEGDEEEEFGAVVEFDEAEDARLRREQDALTPTEQASYEEKLEQLLAEDLDDMLDEIEGPEQVFEPPEIGQPNQILNLRGAILRKQKLKMLKWG